MKHAGYPEFSRCARQHSVLCSQFELFLKAEASPDLKHKIEVLMFVRYG